MGRLDDLLDEMRHSPRSVRYADACKAADAFFGQPRQRGTSHRIWKMPWPGDPRVNLQEGPGGKAKAYQIEQLLQAIDRLRAMQTAGPEVKTEGESIASSGAEKTRKAKKKRS